jgi:hypothetical protein
MSNPVRSPTTAGMNPKPGPDELVVVPSLSAVVPEVAFETSVAGLVPAVADPALDTVSVAMESVVCPAVSASCPSCPAVELGVIFPFSDYRAGVRWGKASSHSDSDHGLPEAASCIKMQPRGFGVMLIVAHLTNKERLTGGALC